MNNPLVSVIMSCYNETEQDLQDSIESILNQTYRNIEFLIVNDNPNNINLKKILNKYRLNDTRIKIINNSFNIGLSKSLNKALSVSSGFYIARMDADDVSYKDRLLKQVTYLETHPYCDLVATNRNDIDESSNIIKECSSIIIPDNIIPIVLKYGSILTHPSIMVKSSILKKLKGYRAFKSAQDYDLWLRMVSLNCKFHIISEPLIKYRIRQNGITNSNFAKMYYESKYIRNLFLQRLNNNGSDSFSDKKLNEIFDLPKSKSEPINQQYEQITSLSKNKFQPGIIFKIILGILKNKDCFINIKNMLMAKILIKLYKR